jgi:hypothetical protein
VVLRACLLPLCLQRSLRLGLLTCPAHPDLAKTAYRIASNGLATSDCAKMTVIHVPDSHKVLIVFLDTRHGTGKPEKVVPWLLISDEQHEQLGGLSMDTLAQWCRATTGQAGVLRLDWQNSGTESFTFEMRPCGFCAPAIPLICRLTRIPALLQTVIPSVEYTSTGRSAAVRGSRNIQTRTS